MPIPTEVTPLGVGGAIPTRDRHLTAFALRREGRVLLFDCGEGTQLQLLRAGLLGAKLEAVFITHLHGDHFYGLPGLLSTLALLERAAPLTVVGPEGLTALLNAAPGAHPGHLPYPVHITEWSGTASHQTVYATDAFHVEARPLSHRIACMGYRYQEASRPGRFDVEAARAEGVQAGPDFEILANGGSVTVDGREVRSEGIVGPERPGTTIAYCLDTAPCDGAVALAQGADLLIHDATFADADADRAEATAHSTARQAAETARQAGARQLLLTHFSARYTETDDLVAQAREVFPATTAAEELVMVPVEPTD
ncbi:MAG: ribonuclease Z [Bacteroidota bacterium]